MAKATVTFEFDSIGSLMDQIQSFMGKQGVVAKTSAIQPPITLKPPVADKPATYPVLDPEPEPQKPEPRQVERAPEPPSATAPEPAANTSQQAPEAGNPVEAAGIELDPDKLGSVPYEVLLNFLRQHPEIGMNADKCGPSFFRDTVEHKIKVYLAEIR